LIHQAGSLGIGSELRIGIDLEMVRRRVQGKQP
jgi:hypothetical protein